MSNPLAIPKTLSSTGTARRWAKNTLLSVRDKRESNKPVAADETELRRLPGTHPSHGPVNISGTLPRRKRRHLTGNATPLNQPGPTSRWNAAHPWVPNEKKEIIDSSRIWECPRRHAAPKNTPVWQTAQLRTRLMEPGDPLPVHKTRAGLLRDLHKTKCHAHPSYDLDGDGVVSITDYKLAKDMDTDGSGHIDSEETRLGRIKLARNFFEIKNGVTSRYHRQSWKEMDKKSAELVEDKHFGKSLRRLQQNMVKRQARGGRAVIDSMTDPYYDHPSARFGAGTRQLSRSQSISEMKRIRKNDFIRDAQASCLPNSFFFEPEVRYGRQSLLTDMKLANHTNMNGDVLRKFKETGQVRAPDCFSPNKATGRRSARAETGSSTARKHLFGAKQ